MRPLRPRAAALIAAIALLFAIPTFAWNEPDSFVGIKWGGTPDEGLRALRERALPNSRTGPACAEGIYFGGIKQTNCRASINLGDALLFGDFRFGADGFFWAFGDFPAEHYELLRSMFIEKFGPPTSTRNDSIVTRGGATVMNESLEWLGEKVALHLSRFGRRITDGTFDALTRAEWDKRVERQNIIQKKGKDGL